MRIGTNLSNKQVVGLVGEKGGVCLTDGEVSDIYYHPKLTAAIERYAGQLLAMNVDGKTLVLQDTRGVTVCEIHGEELVSSMERRFNGEASLLPDEISSGRDLMHR
jgi:hypothetical protein